MSIFFRKSAHWPALFQLSDSISEAGDLSQLWFREFYLEMTMGQRIQVIFHKKIILEKNLKIPVPNRYVYALDSD